MWITWWKSVEKNLTLTHKMLGFVPKSRWDIEFMLVPKLHLGTHLHARFHFAILVEGRNTPAEPMQKGK